MWIIVITSLYLYVLTKNLVGVCICLISKMYFPKRNYLVKPIMYLLKLIYACVCVVLHIKVKYINTLLVYMIEIEISLKLTTYNYYFNIFNYVLTGFCVINIIIYVGKKMYRKKCHEYWFIIIQLLFLLSFQIVRIRITSFISFY